MPRYSRVIRLIEDGGVKRTMDGIPMPEIRDTDLVIVHIIVDPPTWPEESRRDPT